MLIVARWQPKLAAQHLTLANVRRRAFYDKRLSQEVDGEALGEVRAA